MRVVGGKLRSRPIVGPKSDAVRPTADRLREALFNILTHAYDDLVTGKVASKLPHPMPIALSFWAGPGDEPVLIKMASAYESATHHRTPPPAFGPVDAKIRTTSLQ